jgi:hypothetical protein
MHGDNVLARLRVGVAVLTVVLVVLASGCDSSTVSSERSGPTTESGRSATVSPLSVVEAPTPRFPVLRYDTSGTYARVKDGTSSLAAVNAGLREAVLADEREYAPYARREKPLVQYKEHGVYKTAVRRRLVSASTVVVSALLPLTAEVFPGQPGGDRWLGLTVRVPSGEQVSVTDLFSDPKAGIPALASAWKARIRTTSAAPCVRSYSAAYTPTVRHYRAFALLPSGVAVGSAEVGACYRLVAVVPYSVLRPYLSKLGATLIAGVRRARSVGPPAESSPPIEHETTRAERLAPPVIRESINPLPCPRSRAARTTTLGARACLNKLVLRTDARSTRERRPSFICFETGLERCGFLPQRRLGSPIAPRAAEASLMCTGAVAHNPSCSPTASPGGIERLMRVETIARCQRR